MMNWRTFGWILFCGLVACKYDNDQELYPAGSCLHSSNPCVGGKVPEPGMSGYFFYSDPSVVTFVHANPNNENEFIYYKSVDAETDGIGKLYKYNLETSERLLLYSGLLMVRPSWGKNGWILLNPSDRKLWRVKDNGDSLQIVDESYLCFGGLWDYQGDRFMYGWQDEQFTYVGLPVRNSDLQLVDTLTKGGTSWFNEVLINPGFDSQFSVGVFDYGSNQTYSLPMKTNNPNEMMLDACWSHDGQVIYFTGGISGLFSYDYTTHEQLMLRCKCANEFYLNLGPCGTEHLLAIRNHWEDLGHSSIRITSVIVKIKTDGSEEAVITLPN